MASTANQPLATKLNAAEAALMAAIKAFSDFDNTATAWRRVLDAESECRKALEIIGPSAARAATDVQVNSRRWRFLSR